MLLWRFVTSASCSLRSCGPDRLAIIRFNRKFAGSGTGAGTGAGTYAISISTTLALISIHSTSFFRILYWMCHWLNWSLISFPYLFLYAHTSLKSLSLGKSVVPFACTPCACLFPYRWETMEHSLLWALVGYVQNWNFVFKCPGNLWDIIIILSI